MPTLLPLHARLRPAAAVLIALAALGPATARLNAQPPASVQAPGATSIPALTVDWIFGEDGKSIARLPAAQWLADGSLLLLDATRPDVERTFERIDPATGERRPLLDMARAVASLRLLVSDADVKKTLAWPAAVDRAGSRALYVFSGDVFLLDFATASFRRLTTSDAEEKSVSFSPDGTRVAFVRGHDLYVMPLSPGSEVRLTRDGSDTILNGTLSWVYWEEIFARRDIGYWWAPDSSALAFLHTDESPVAVSTFVDFAPATPRVIRQRYPKAGTPNPMVRVGLVQADGTKMRWVNIDDRPFEYIARVQWLPDSRRVSVQTLTRAQTELGLYVVDRDTGRAARILTETDPGWVNLHDDLHFLADGRHFLWVSERDGYQHLYRYTLEGQLVNQVTRGDWALASAGGGVYWLRQSVVGVDEKNGWIYFTSLERSSVERHLYRIRPDGSGMTRLTSETGTHRIAMSPDTRYFLDRFSSARTLPVMAVHHTDGPRATELARARSDLLSRLPVQFPELSTIPAADGFAMPAAILKPSGFDAARKHAVILYVYGGPSAPTVSNAWDNDLLFDQLLLQAGFVVVRVDNRSATGMSKRLENVILKASGEPETDDLVAAVRWLKAQPWVDPSRVGVWGWSGGGTMTLNLMTRSTEFKAGIAVAAVTDWHYYDSKWAEAFMKRPEDNPEGYERTSLVKRAGQLHGHLLLVHGTYDDNVHPQNAFAFIDALVAADKPFEVMMYPMRKHGIDDDAATVHLYKHMLAFWRRAL
jgi:dipeptidyl-peptidase-4